MFHNWNQTCNVLPLQWLGTYRLFQDSELSCSFLLLLDLPILLLPLWAYTYGILSTLSSCIMHTSSFSLTNNIFSHHWSYSVFCFFFLHFVICLLSLKRPNTTFLSCDISGLDTPTHLPIHDEAQWEHLWIHLLMFSHSHFVIDPQMLYSKFVTGMSLRSCKHGTDLFECQDIRKSLERNTIIMAWVGLVSLAEKWLKNRIWLVDPFSQNIHRCWFNICIRRVQSLLSFCFC
jgi:hypothetical protein